MTNDDLKYSILKISNILYLEDEDVIRNETSGILKSFFSNVYTASDGKEGIELYLKHKNDIDIIITDLNMPNVNGIEFMAKVREHDKDIPVLVSTAFSDTSNIIKAIKLKVADYILKPMQITTTLKIIHGILNDSNNNKLIYQQKVELENFKKALDEQNIIFKFSLDGNITEVNNLFCQISGFTKEELINQHLDIIRHPDVSSAVFDNLNTTIKNSQIWIGKLKNLAKDGSVYHTKTTIIPIFSLDKELVEYISMSILTTEEEEEKQNLKRLILHQKTKELKSVNNIKEKIASEVKSALEINEKNETIKNEKLNEYLNNLQDQLKTTRAKLSDEKSRVLGLDKKLKLTEDKMQEAQETSHSKLVQLHKLTQNAIFKYDKMKKREMILEDKLLKAQQSITILQNYNEEYKDKITDLNTIVHAAGR